MSQLETDEIERVVEALEAQDAELRRIVDAIADVRQRPLNASRARRLAELARDLERLEEELYGARVDCPRRV
jgi:RNA polymerase-interacting CarD/CdnL/TRCF family regulator